MNDGDWEAIPTYLRTTRTAFAVFIGFVLALWSGVIGCTTPAITKSRPSSTASPLSANLRDGWIGLPGDSPFDETRLFASPIALQPDTPSSTAVLTSVYEHPHPVNIPGGFRRALMSWNIKTPPGTGAWFEVRAWRAPERSNRPGTANDAGWTPWLFIGEWGDVTPELAGWHLKTKATNAQVDVDEFVSPDSWDLLQWRVVAASRTPAQTISVHNVVISTTLDEPRSPSFWASEAAGTLTPRELPVPFRSQKTDTPALAGRLCSPTSVAMVLGLHGHDVSVQQVASLAYDRRHDIYGNWPRNIQAAYDLGVSGALVRFSSWHDVRMQVEQGRAVIISFAADKGELPEAPYESTSGHLIVIRGFDRNGDVLVNDPACGTEQDGRRTYSRKDLTRVWLQNSRGTAYVLWPTINRTPSPIRELAAPASTEPTK